MGGASGRHGVGRVWLWLNGIAECVAALSVANKLEKTGSGQSE